MLAIILLMFKFFFYEEMSHSCIRHAEEKWPQTLRYVVNKVHSFRGRILSIHPLIMFRVGFYTISFPHKLSISPNLFPSLSLSLATCRKWSICTSKECADDPYHLGLQFNVASLPPNKHVFFWRPDGDWYHPTEPCLTICGFGLWGEQL